MLIHIYLLLLNYSFSHTIVLPNYYILIIIAKEVIYMYTAGTASDLHNYTCYVIFIRPIQSNFGHNHVQQINKYYLFMSHRYIEGRVILFLGCLCNMHASSIPCFDRYHDVLSYYVLYN